MDPEKAWAKGRVCYWCGDLTSEPIKLELVKNKLELFCEKCYYEFRKYNPEDEDWDDVEIEGPWDDF